MDISSEGTSCYTNFPSNHHHHHHQDHDHDLNHLQANNNILYGLSILRDKLHQLQSLLTLSPATEAPPPPPYASVNIHNAVQDIITTASSMLLTLQAMTSSSVGNAVVSSRSTLGQPSVALDHPTVLDNWPPYGFNGNGNDGGAEHDVVELAAEDLLAKYTHYCHVCGKGFKRDANLRMHMRAHGDEYKTAAALSRNGSSASAPAPAPARKYSCPQEGCRWNRRHPKFQALKSMVCAKNHYRRSHCPKMYVCRRCGRKEFSVLSDLRTHEKHCGDLKWRCSCGTTFSRKDKLIGHVSLFHGHAPAVVVNGSSSAASSRTAAKLESQVMSQFQIDSIVKNMID